MHQGEERAPQPSVTVPRRPCTLNTSLTMHTAAKCFWEEAAHLRSSGHKLSKPFSNLSLLPASLPCSPVLASFRICQHSLKGPPRRLLSPESLARYKSPVFGYLVPVKAKSHLQIKECLVKIGHRVGEKA